MAHEDSALFFKTRSTDATGAIPHTLTLIPTYQCTAQCKDCCFHSNPRIKHRVPQDRLLRYIDEATELGTIRLVVFTGGEVFLLQRDLVELVRRCSQHGFLTRIVTNGYWAVNEKGANERLAPLVEAGLGEINFSTGDDHVEFVPVERVITGLHTSMQRGLGLALMIEQRETRTVTRDTVLLAAARYPELHRALNDGRVHITESPWMRFSSDTPEISWDSNTLANAANIHARKPCTSILANIVVTPNERLGMCCGLPREDIADLNVGDLRTESMLSIFERHLYDFLKLWLFVEGPEKMLAWAATKDSTIVWEDRYAHNCDVCRVLYNDPRIMRVFFEHGREKVDSVLNLFAIYTAGTVPLTLVDSDGVQSGEPRVSSNSTLRQVHAGTLVQITVA